MELPESLGKFYPEVVQELNDLLSIYQLAPGYGNDDETTYYVRYEEGDDVHWDDLRSIDNRQFISMWENIKDQIIFKGQIYVLEHEKSFRVGRRLPKTVDISDRVARAFRRNSTQSVLQVLGQAYHIMYDPENEASMTQGAISRVVIKNDNMPTLEFIGTQY
jgi:hypothetical protein